MINLNQKPISDENELSFAIFCIENVALKLGVSADKVYHACVSRWKWYFKWLYCAML